MMMLAEWRSHWFLSTGVKHLTGECFIRSGRMMWRPETFLPVPPAGFVYYGRAPLAEVRLFPTIRYRGAFVYPKSWNPDSAEPLLSVLMMPWDLREAGVTIDELVADGWQYDQRDGGEKYVHVDELEKIEGPPPAPPPE